MGYVVSSHPWSESSVLLRIKNIRGCLNDKGQSLVSHISKGLACEGNMSEHSGGWEGFNLCPC